MVEDPKEESVKIIMYFFCVSFETYDVINNLIIIEVCTLIKDKFPLPRKIKIVASHTDKDDNKYNQVKQ